MDLHEITIGEISDIDLINILTQFEEERKGRYLKKK